MPISPTTSPTTAVTIGMPIATMVPNARLRMIMASTIPTSSLLSVAGFDRSDPTVPPAAMSVMPAARRGRDAMSRISWAFSSVRSALPMSSRTGMKAVLPSLESCPVPCWLKGLGALTTSCVLARAAADLLTASLYVASLSLPDGARKTIGFLPFCWGGNFSARTSVAAWLSVPGRLRSLVVFAPNRPTRPINAMAISAHATITRSRWPATHLPTR